jgi:hypothetical protein
VIQLSHCFVTPPQAPSFHLDEYLTKLQHGTTSSSNPQLASSMHAAFVALQEAVAAARQHLGSMQQLADDCAESALAVPLQGEQELTAGANTSTVVELSWSTIRVGRGTLVSP